MFKNKMKKAITIGLIGISTITSLFSSPIQASAHNAYFVGITIDEGNFRYIPNVIYEENSWVASNHREKDLGNFAEKTCQSNANWQVPIVDNEGKTESDMENSYKNIVSPGNGEKALIYTFPPIHGKGFITDKVNATAQDEMLANRYAEYVVGGLNDALAFCINKSNAKSKVSTSTLKMFSADLANKAHIGSGTVTLNGVTFTISKANIDKPLEGLTENDYITISSGKESITVPRRVKKGYVNSDERTGLSKDYEEMIAGTKTGHSDKKDTEYLDWRYTVLQGNYNSDVKSINYSSATEIIKPNIITVMISDFFSSTLSGLRTIFGLYSLEDLMLNEGSRSNSYYYGIMPNNWMLSANLLHIICQILAWTLMGFSFVKLLYKRQLQTMNIGERISLMEGFKNLIFTAILLGIFPLGFATMAKFNEILVDLFASSSAFSSYIGTTHTMTSGVFATVIINFAFFFVNVYFNFFYIVRAITVAILFGIAPLCIYTLSLGGKQAQIFSNFSLELVSNIFIQSFHAICVAFFTSITSTTQMRTFETLVVFLSFIPLTKFIRDNVFGLSSGFTESGKDLMATTIGAGMIAGGVVSGFKEAKEGVSGIQGIQNTVNSSNPANSNIQNAIANRNLHSNKDSIGAGGIENSDLMKNISGVSNKSNASNEVDLTNSKIESLGKIAKGIGQSTGALALAGASMGFGSIGDKRSLSRVAMAGNSLMKDGVSSISNGFSDLVGDNIENPMLKNTGISNLYDGGERMTNLYNADVSDDDKITFSDPALNQSDYADNLREMYNVFNGTGDYSPSGTKANYIQEAKAKYQNQGIQGVGQYNGKLAVVYNKKMTENKNFGLRNIGEITPYIPKNQFNQQSNNNK